MKNRPPNFVQAPPQLREQYTGDVLLGSYLRRALSQAVLEAVEGDMEADEDPRHIGKILRGKLATYWRYRVGESRHLL